ncbi:hypothetical protein BGZ75_002001 [Mortierella antarctica]|nr:hypothetical protein BGZ67_005376 [Mortierella alpina]KAF9986285.1 hypothetical protein BGZ75_002001 [Mortierella antarctica]
MADRATTSAATPRRTSAAGNGNRTSARPTNQSTGRASRTTRPATTATAATATISATPSSSPETAAGPSGAMIGGIAAGVVMVFGLVGLLFYKKRKRATVAAAEAKKSKAIAMSGTSAPISGPLALAPEKGIDSAPAHRPEAHFREQQQFRPGMRDELFAQPGSALHTTLSNKNKSNTTLINNDSRTNLTSNMYNNNSSNNGRGMDSSNIKSNNNNQGGTPKDGPPPSDDYYDDHLVHDYYGGSDSPEAIGAQRPAPQSRDLSLGNLTPAPEYYLGKEDIDPRRDLRGLDSPETYVRQAAIAGSTMGSDPRQMQGADTSRYSDDHDSVYMTPEQAQQAHNHRMRGPKDSIGSVAMLHLDPASPPQPQERATHRPPDHSLSVAMSESTMSVMPSLPPADGGQYDRRMQQQQRPGGARPSPPGPGPGPLSPMSSIAMEDPYAESAYSDEYRDDRSMASPGYPQQRQQPYRPQYPHDNGRGSPYSSGPMSPPYDSHHYPQQQGYNHSRPYQGGSPPYNSSRPQQPPRGNKGGGGYGPGRPGPGPGYGGPQQGYRAPQQRDPGYNDGPYQRQY